MSAITIVMATGGPPGALKATSCCLNDKLDQPGSIAPLGSMVSVSSVDDDDCGLVGRLSSPTAEFGHAAGHNAMHRTEPSLSQTVDVRTKTFQDIRRQSELRQPTNNVVWYAHKRSVPFGTVRTSPVPVAVISPMPLWESPR